MYYGAGPLYSALPWSRTNPGNPWRQHPALEGVPVPEGKLPPTRHWHNAQRLGLVFGRAVAANVPSKRTEGPVPPLVKKKRGGIKAPPDATKAVYQWLVDQARLRLKDVQSHLRTQLPTLGEIAFKYHVPPSSVERWARDLRAQKEKSPRLPQPFRPQDLYIPRGSIYFGSGAQGSPGEIFGFARLAEQHGGFGVGVQAQDCGPDCLLALSQLAGRGTPVFVDSGAYEEFTKQRPISDADWSGVLGVYDQIAKAYRQDAYLVAPDKIGDQRETARRLAKFMPTLVGLAKKRKANLLLVAQGGATPRWKFWNAEVAKLRRAGVPASKIVGAMPMQAKAAKIPELVEFVKRAKGLRMIHLLGIGPGRVEAAYDAVKKARPDLRVIFDSVLITRGVGRGFLGVEPQIYTYAQDLVRYPVMHEAFQKSFRGSGTMEDWVTERGWSKEAVPDYTDHIYEEASFWLPRAYRRDLADFLQTQRGGLSAAQRKLLLSDPGEFFYQRGEDPALEAWLDDQWARFLGAYYSALVKREGILRAWRRGSLADMRREIPGIETAVEEVMFPKKKRVAKKRVLRTEPRRQRREPGAFDLPDLGSW